MAGGIGRRFSDGVACSVPKQFRMLGALPVLGHTINAFAQALGRNTPIVVVLPSAHIDFWKNLSARFPVSRHLCVEGGPERFHSVANGISALPDDVALIAVHDGVRPLVSGDLIARCVSCAVAHGTAVPVVPVVDSLRGLDENGGSHVVPREKYRAVQTPQLFEAWMLREAYRQPYSPTFTDDASVVEAAGHTVTLCEGDRENIKITVESDLKNL